MQVSLIDFTGAGSHAPAHHAACLLAFTKSTRLTMSPGLMDDIKSWPQEKLEDELKYMANTIPSSWEFVHYTFLVEGVSRAYTHQQVRTRTASFAQQTMRVLDVSQGAGWDYITGPSIEAAGLTATYDKVMGTIAEAYRELVANGAKIEDARGVLPTNISTNIVISMNMRTFVETVRKRTSPRVQGEYRNVLMAMHKAVAEVHPWIRFFLDRDGDVAARELYAAIMKFAPEDERMNLCKLLDKVYAGQ